MGISQRRISAGLNSLGLVSTLSERVSEGEYEPFDADWNYKDIPHLAEVHRAVDGVVISAETEHTSSVFLQRLGPLRFPMTVYIGESGDQGAVYVASAGPFVMVVETTWVSIGELRTRVTTRYEVFSSKRLKPLHRLIHRALSRNYDILMSEDLPMRNQRGRLRRLGYTFVGDKKGYGFRESSNIHARNIISPVNPFTTKHRVVVNQLQFGRNQVGGEGEDGLILERDESSLTVFPRICDHEGADLECSLRHDRGLRCPWHGRVVEPLVRIDLESSTCANLAGDTAIQFVGDEILISRNLANSETA